MGQKNKRRQRPSDVEARPKPVEITHDWEKSDDELELEQALFGASGKGRSNGFKAASGEARSSADEGGLSDLEDDDVGGEVSVRRLCTLITPKLFMVDAPLAPQYQLDLEGAPGAVPEDADSDDGEDDDSDSDDGSDSDASSSGSSSAHNEFRAMSPSSSRSSSPDVGEDKPKDRPTISVPDDVVDLQVEESRIKGKERAVLWHDPADDLVGVDMSENRRLRKLDRGNKKRKVEGGEMIDGKELQGRLREQFETLHPPPKWAKNRTVAGTPSLSSLLTSTRSFIAPSSAAAGQSRPPLPQGNIDLQRVRNANQQNPTTGKREAANAGGGVVDFAWHPSERVGVMAVAGGDRRVRFFNIDGHTNPTLMTLHIPALPLSRSTFHPSGSSLLLVGNRPYYYTYDLASQRCLRSPRNLFGSVDTPSSPNSLHRHAFSPDGSLLAVAGRRGAVSILDWSSGGSGGVVAELRSGRGGGIADLLWDPSGKALSVLGGRDNAEVEVWDLGERRIKTKWRDDRALGGTIMKASKDGSYTAVGSNTGIVNLYSSSSLSAPSSSKLAELTPEPTKSLEQLTMPISSMAFHPSSEILVTASTGRKDLLKMIHLPSGTAFSNWPTPATPLGRVTSTGFSASGEYLAVGNQRGTVLLWSLRHYAL